MTVSPICTRLQKKREITTVHKRNITLSFFNEKPRAKAWFFPRMDYEGVINE